MKVYPLYNRNVTKAILFCSAAITCAGCCVNPAPPSFGEQFSGIENLMTQAEVVQTLGPPPKKRSDKFPAGPFMGPAEGMVGVIAPGQPYEEWEYTSGGEVFLIFFAGQDVDDPPNQWNVVGKMQYPQGAAF